jgi:hypothetical protein
MEEDVHSELERAVFALGEAVRYVAFGEGQHVQTRQRHGVVGASSSESDRYEELLVNPTLLTLARQRGELDCGGVRFLIVAYGNFNQLVFPTAAGHLSVALDRASDPLRYAAAIVAEIERHRLPPRG